MDFELLDGRGAEYGVQHFRVLKPQALAGLVSLVGKISIAHATELVDLGAVYVNEIRLMDAHAEMSENDRVRAHLTPRRFTCQRGLRSRIVATGTGTEAGTEVRTSGGTLISLLDSRSSYLVVDKPAGLPTHAQVDNAKENLISLLEHELNEGSSEKLKLLITHRLDVETSGLLILALRPDAQTKINLNLAAKRIRRRYHAWVEKPVEPGVYRHFMKPSPEAPKVVSPVGHPGWKECCLEVLSCEPHDRILDECGLECTEAALARLGSNPHWRVTLELTTGRSQQIRAQFSELGSPIIGDAAYGSPYAFTGAFASGAAIALRAFEISGVSLSTN